MNINYISFQFSSVTQLCPTLCAPMDCSTPGLPGHHHSRCLLKLMSIMSVMPSNHFILCCPLLLLPSIFPSIRVFSNESGDSQESSLVPQFKNINSTALSLLYGPTFTSIHDYWKNHSFDHMVTIWTFVGKVSLLFNMLSRLVITFLSRSKQIKRF